MTLRLSSSSGKATKCLASLIPTLSMSKCRVLKRRPENIYPDSGTISLTSAPQLEDSQTPFLKLADCAGDKASGS